MVQYNVIDQPALEELISGSSVPETFIRNHIVAAIRRWTRGTQGKQCPSPAPADLDISLPAPTSFDERSKSRNSLLKVDQLAL